MDVAEAMIKFVIRTGDGKAAPGAGFFNSFVDKGLLERLEHVASARLRPGDLYRSSGDSGAAQRPV